MIREVSRGYAAPDEISEVLGDARYAQNWYPPGLKERTVGSHSLDLVSVSRHYFLMRPRVVVDFEPSPLDAKFWIDEKRRWCFEQGIVYVPIMLGDRLTKEQFKARVEEEQSYLLSGSRVHKDLSAIAGLLPEDVLKNLPPDRNVEDVLAHPATLRWIDEETLRRFEVQRSGKPGLYGGARTSLLVAVKRTVIEDVRERIKHGRMGRLDSDQQPAVAARG